MENNHAPLTPEEQIRSMYEDERTQNRIQEHLNNEHDVITEQDIANISTGIVHPQFQPGTELEGPAEDLADQAQPATKEAENLEDKKLRDDKDPEIETPWDILS